MTRATRACLFVCLLSGCTGTEVGNPPFTPEPPPEPGFAVSSVRLDSDPATDMHLEELYFRIPPDQLKDGARLVVVDLDDESPPTEAVADPMGAFSTLVRATTGDVIRAQLRTPELRRPPVDFRVDEARQLVLLERQLEDCVRFEGRDFAISDELGVLIRNDCSMPLAFAAPRFRLGTMGFGVALPMPFEVAPGEVVGVALDRMRSAMPPPTATEIEDHLFLELTSPVAERFVITIHAAD